MKAVSCDSWLIRMRCQGLPELQLLIELGEGQVSYLEMVTMLAFADLGTFATGILVIGLMWLSEWVGASGQEARLRIKLFMAMEDKDVVIHGKDGEELEAWELFRFLNQFKVNEHASQLFQRVFVKSANRKNEWARRLDSLGLDVLKASCSVTELDYVRELAEKLRLVNDENAEILRMRVVVDLTLRVRSDTDQEKFTTQEEYDIWLKLEAYRCVSLIEVEPLEAEQTQFATKLEQVNANKKESASARPEDFELILQSMLIDAGKEASDHTLLIKKRVFNQSSVRESQA